MKLTDTQRIGLGCMNLSHGYGHPLPETDAVQLLNTALDNGYNHFDTAALYGLGANESLIGKAVAHRRDEFFLSSKCVLIPGENGQRQLDGRPETIVKTCENALKRLNTDFIDLYYLHRYDKKVPIEDSVGALADLVRAGKIGAIGLSEMSADTLRKAHAVHPVTAMQSEYSLWSRNADIAVIDTCAELQVSFVAFSPLGRGFLSGLLTDLSHLPDSDMRRHMPRFTADNYAHNLTLLPPLAELAADLDVSMSQLALAWVLKRAPHIIAIPGTTQLAHLLDNLKALRISLSDEHWHLLDRAINDQKVQGPRYSDASQAEIDTEIYA